MDIEVKALLLRTVILVTVVHYAAAQLSTAQTDHLVTGRVIDTNGADVPNSLVQAMPVPSKSNEPGGVVSSTSRPWTATDSRGIFTLRLSPGEYKFIAKNESKGYADPIYLLDRDPTAKFPRVTVGKGNLPEIVILLGKRGGVLVGELIDQETHVPISNGKITVCDANNSDLYVDVFSDNTGHFQIAIPSKPVVISAIAKGYRTQAFAGGRHLELSEGEHRIVAIELERK